MTNPDQKAAQIRALSRARAACFAAQTKLETAERIITLHPSTDHSGLAILRGNLKDGITNAGAMAAAILDQIQKVRAP